MPVIWRSNSPAKCWVEPRPTLAKLSLPGEALASATSPLMSLAGKSLRATTTKARVGDQRHRREILDRVVGHRLDHHRRHGVAGADHGGGVAVLVGFRDLIAGDRAAGARLVLDHHGLVQQFGQRRGDDAGHDVGAAAGAEADDHADRLVVRPFGQSRRGRSVTAAVITAAASEIYFMIVLPLERPRASLRARLLLLPPSHRFGGRLSSYFSSSIGLRSTPTPSTSISQTSPGFIQTGSGLRAWPTPDGVPVNRMSPGSSVMPSVR